MKAHYLIISAVLMTALAVPVSAQAPQPVTVERLLYTAAEDGAVLTQREKLDLLDGSGPSLPVLDDVEIRVRNRGFDTRQRYSLRLEPRGWGESKAARELYAGRVDYRTHRAEVMKNRALKQRYMLVLEYLERQALLAANRQLQVLCEDRIRVLEKKSGGKKFKLTDLIKAEDDFTDMKMQIIRQEKNLDLVRREIDRIMPDLKFTAFDTSGFITVPFIDRLVMDSVFTLDSANVHLKNELLQLKVSECRYDLEAAEGRRYLSLLEFSWDHGEWSDEWDKGELGRDYDLNQAYTIEAGVRLPFFSVDRHDINRRKLAYLDDEQDYRRLKKELEARIEKDSEDLRVLLTQYRYLKAREDDVNAESSLKRYLQMEGVDPKVLLSINERLLKNGMEKTRARFDILRNYIRLIDATGGLCRAPLRNYLAEGLPELKK